MKASSDAHGTPCVTTNLKCGASLVPVPSTGMLGKVAVSSVTKTPGVVLSSFTRGGSEQGALFEEREAGRRAALYRAFDRVRTEFGHGVLVSGRALHLKGRLDEDEHGFVLRTPSLTK